MHRSGSAALRRVLQQRHVIALAFGAMVGWSWVVLAGQWLLDGGAWGAVVAFGIGGLAIVLIGLTYAELASAMPVVGGEHAYSLRALGRPASFVCTWAIVLGYLSVVAFEAVALPTALEFLVPGFSIGPLWTVAGWQVEATWVASGILGALLMTWVNLRGVRVAAELQTWVTWLILLAGVIFVLGAALRGGGEHTAAAWGEDGWNGALRVLVMVPFLFVGFDVLPQAAEEIDLPPRRIGTLLVVAVLMAVLWYVAIVFAVGRSLDGEAIAAADLATAEASRQVWGGAWAGMLLVVAGLAGIVTSWNAFLVGGSRALLALAEHDQLPRWFAKVSETGTPVNAVLFIGALSALAPLFGRPALIWLVDAGGLGIVIAYGMVAISFLVLRRREPDLERPFRAPGGSLVGWLALLVSIGLAALYLPGSPSALVWPAEWVILFAWTALGGALYRIAAH